MKTSAFILIASFASVAAAAGPPPHAGGPPSHSGQTALSESGRAVNFVGTRSVMTTLLSGNCDAVPASIVCVELEPAPATTSYQVEDVLVVEIPAGAVNSLLCFDLSALQGRTWSNTQGARTQLSDGLFVFWHVESPAFAGVMGPDGTELAYSESVNLGGESRFVESGTSGSWRSMPGRQCVSALTNRVLTNVYEMTDAQLRDMYAQPMTVRFGISGSTRLVTQGDISLFVRFYGD